MITSEQFLAVLDDELGLAIDAADLDRDVDDVAGWDSVNLLRLLIVLEARTGRQLSFERLLAARTLGGIHRLAAGDA